MKQSFLLLIAVLIVQTTFAQPDTTCISSRWIAVRKTTPENRTLFRCDTAQQSLNDLLLVVRSLAIDNKIAIRNDEVDYKRKHQWYVIPYIGYEVDNRSGDTVEEIKRSDYLAFKVQPPVPMANPCGEDSVLYNSTGYYYEYVYPPPRQYGISLADLTEVRIREDRLYNPLTGRFGFRATGISFYVEGRYPRELFWVDLEELFANLPDPTEVDWYNVLINRTYSGFQYLQTSCYDDCLRY